MTFMILAQYVWSTENYEECETQVRLSIARYTALRTLLIRLQKLIINELHFSVN